MKKAGLSKDNTAFLGRRYGGVGGEKKNPRMSCLIIKKVLTIVK
jgi:hypothetical protein